MEVKGFMGKEIFKVGKIGWQVLGFGFLIMLLVAMLERWNVIDLSSSLVGILVFFSALFVVAEVLAERSKKELGILEWTGLALAGIVGFSVALGWLGVDMVWFAPFEGFILLVLLAYLAYELFRK